jgi:hypothetical protein
MLSSRNPDIALGNHNTTGVLEAIHQTNNFYGIAKL